MQAHMKLPRRVLHRCLCPEGGGPSPPLYRTMILHLVGNTEPAHRCHAGASRATAYAWQLGRSGHAEAVAGVHGVGAELLLDAQQLIVLAEALRAAGRAGLDLAGLEADGEVGDEGVLGLA